MSIGTPSNLPFLILKIRRPTVKSVLDVSSIWEYGYVNVHTLTHALTHALTHTFTHALTHTLTHALYYRTQIGSVTVWFVQKQTVTHEISSSTSENVALFVQDGL